MGMNRFGYTELEVEAMKEKYDHPEREVRCPRCGNVLDYARYPTSEEVTCRTEKCIRAACRGI